LALDAGEKLRRKATRVGSREDKNLFHREAQRGKDLKGRYAVNKGAGLFVSFCRFGI